NMSTLALIGIALTIFVNEYWIILPIIVLSFFLQHALHGWRPPLPIFRAMGNKTRAELDRENYALKVLKGDFSGLPKPADPNNAVMILQAITKNEVIRFRVYKLYCIKLISTCVKPRGIHPEEYYSRR